MTLRNVAAIVFLLVAAIATPKAASAQTKVRFTLDWIPGATHGAFLIALQKGYYKQEGLDVTIDRGKGSAEVVRQLASGVYDMGFPDINVVIDFDLKNPDQAFPVLMSGYEEAPAAIITLKSSGINEPKQLDGKKLGSAPSDFDLQAVSNFRQADGHRYFDGAGDKRGSELARNPACAKEDRCDSRSDLQFSHRAAGQGRGA